MADSDPQLERDEKRELELEKLRLEVKSLSQQVSTRVNWLEWAKAVTGPVAVLGLVASVVLGSLQIRTATEARLEDRYQKEVAHLGSSSPSERLTGVAGLSLILSDSSERERHREVASFLVNALVVEQDPTVRAGLVGALQELEALNPIESPIVSQTLSLLVDRNRVLSRLHEFSQEELTTDGAERSPKVAPLLDSGILIAQFIRNGAKLRDLSEITCIGCDFSGSSVDLSGADFRGAILVDAKFDRANLDGAKFTGSVLVEATFLGSKLKGADLRDFAGLGNAHHRNLFKEAVLLPGAETVLPNFKCADLTKANFDGRLLFAIEPSEQGRTTALADFEGANLDSTILNRFSMLYVSDEKNLKPNVPFDSAAMRCLGRPSNRPEVGKHFSCLIETYPDWNVEPIWQGSMKLEGEARSGFFEFTDDLSKAKNLDKAVLAPKVRTFRQQQRPLEITGIPVGEEPSHGSTDCSSLSNK